MTRPSSTPVPLPLRPVASAFLSVCFLLVTLLALTLAPKTSAQTFVHPGLLHTEADFLRMKTKVDAGAQPWLSGWNALTNDWNSQLGAGTRAAAEITRPGNVAQMYTDIYHAYACALRWKVSGDTRYADEAVRFLNTWSSTMTSLTGSADRFLAAGIHGYQWANIAEIMRTYPGWAPADITRFQDWLIAHFYSLNETFLWGKDGGKDHNGAAITNYWSNWDLCNMASALAIGVFCDRRDIHDRAMAYIYTGAGNGALDRVIYQMHDGKLGQMQESGRDQGHTTLSISLLGAICEMAWNQGADLYGYRDNRVLSAAEYVTRYNSGNDVPYDSYMWGTGVNGTWQIQPGVSPAGRPSHRPWAEMLYNHYVNRLGLAAPFTKAEAEYGRPETNGGNGDQLGWGTLTFTRDPIAEGSNPKLSLVQRAGDVVLSWWGSAYATGYNIKRTTTPGGPYVTLAAGLNGIDATYTDTTATSPGAYYYIVTGVLPTAQETAPSNEVRAAFPAELSTWLQADETTGATATDSSGRGHHATLVNGPTWVAGKTGNALALDGVNDHATLPADVIASLSDFTIATWVYLDESRTWSRIFDFGGKPGSYLFLTPRSGSGGTRFAITTVYGYNEQAVEGPALPVGQWTHVAVTLSDQVLTLYINGVAVAQKLDCFLQPLQLGETPQNWIGRSQFANDPYLKGKIDDFRIYDYALRGHEVHALGYQGANRAPSFVGERVTLAAASEDANYSASAQSLATVAGDPDGSSPTFTKLEGPAWLNVASNGALSGTPTNADVGRNTFLVRVSDATGSGEVARIQIDVTNANDAPVWSANPLAGPPVTRDVAYAGTLAGSASDIDPGATLAFSKVSGPAWLSVAADGALSGTPALSDVGANSFVVRVTDDTGAAADTTLNIAVLGDTLVARHLLDGTAADAQGGAAATLSGTAAYAPGAVGQALVFDGSTTYANLAIPSPAIYKDFTFAAWVWWDGGAIWQRIFDFGSGTADYMFLSPAGGSGMRFEITTGGVAQGLNAPALPTGAWVHVAITLGGSTATLYVNGSAVATSNAITNEPTSVNLTANYLGKSQWPDPLFAGKLDDVRLYNHALGASSVSALVHGIPPITPSGLVASPLSNRVTLSWKTTANAQSYTVKRATSPGGPYATLATGLAAASYVDTAVSSGSTYYYVVVAVNAQGESAPCPEVPAVVSDLLVHLKLDETAGATANDASGNEIHGTLVNSPVWTGGYFANAVNLSASAGQHVALPSGVVSSLTDYTLSCWVKLGTLATNSRIFDFGTSATPGAGTGAYMFLTPQYSGGADAGKLRFAITNAGWNNEQSFTTTAALVPGAWTHVAVTRSGTTARIYLNGALAGTHASMTLAPSNLGATTRNYLGRSQFSGDPYLDGSIDDFRIYSRALAAAELSALGRPAAGAPTRLAAVPGDGQAVLSWAPNATTTYAVKRSASSGGPYAVVAAGLTNAAYTDTGLTNGVVYYYVVSGANADGPGPDSAEVSVVPSTLRIHLEFDETDGALAADASGHARHAALVGAPAFAAGRLGNALSLVAGSSQYATLPADSVQGLGAVTIMAWVKPATTTQFTRVFDFGGATAPGSTSGTYMFLSPNIGGVLRFAITTAGYNNEQQISGNTALPAGGWSHVAVILNGTTGRLYLNGNLIGASSGMTLTPAALGTLANLYLGKSQFSADPYLGGAIDDFRIYGHAMSSAELAPYASPLAAPQNLAAAPGPLSLDLSWNAVANATRYTVKYATVSGGPYATLSSGASATSQPHSGLSYGATYYYVVSAGNAVYESPFSAELAATPASALIGEAESAPPSLVLAPASGGNPATATLTTGPSAAGHSYQLQTSADLAAGQWFDVGEPRAGTGAALVFETPYDPSEPRRFYRVLITR